MKSLTKLFLLGACALGMAAVAEAQSTVIRLSGSTAYRSQTHQAIKDLLAPGGYTYAFTEKNSGDGLNRAIASIFHGTVNGSPVTIQAGWTGSVEGIRDVVTSVNNQQPFVPTSVTGASGAGTAVAESVANEAGIPDVALSDCGQGSTVYATLTQLEGERQVGLIPFRFFTNADAPFDAVTDQQIQALYAAGQLPLSFFTGDNSADHHTRQVYAAGRANSSGTRLIMHQEIGIGANTSVNQWSLNGARDTLTFIGNNGVGGSALAAYVSGALSGSLANSYFVVYVGGSDATTAVTNGAKELKYNGQFFGGDNKKVQVGHYTFWGYEQFLYRPTLNGVAKTVADLLAAQIKQNDLVLSGMNVQRNSDGGLISSNLQ